MPTTMDLINLSAADSYTVTASDLDEMRSIAGAASVPDPDPGVELLVPTGLVWSATGGATGGVASTTTFVSVLFQVRTNRKIVVRGTSTGLRSGYWTNPIGVRAPSLPGLVTANLSGGGSNPEWSIEEADGRFFELKIGNSAVYIIG